MMSARLYTSTEAAKVLGASPTSVKRWADEGLLRCVKTVGNHRRFEHEELLRFRRERMGEPSTPDVEAWVDDLTGNRSADVMARLFAARAELGSWARVGDRLGEVLELVGTKWRRGEISVAQEHVASERLRRDLERVAETIPLSERSPVALLLTLEEEDHTLGLSLLALTLREQRWRSIWVGANTPTDGMAGLIRDHGAKLVCVSASVYSSDEASLADAAEEIGAICDDAGATLLLGGSGAWPDEPARGARLRSLDEVTDHLPAT